MTNIGNQILAMMRYSDGLKRELRHSWLSDGRRESVAEHTWNMALLAVLVHPHLEHPVSLEKTLKMILVHDLPEAEAGDIPFFEQNSRQAAKADREKAAMAKISGSIPEPAAVELPALWEEFELNHTAEAKFARALDNLEVQIQHNLADFSTWEPIECELVYTKMDRYCEHDACLRKLCDEVKREAETKMVKGGVDVPALKRRLNV